MARFKDIVLAVERKQEGKPDIIRAGAALSKLRFSNQAQKSILSSEFAGGQQMLDVLGHTGQFGYCVLTVERRATTRRRDGGSGLWMLFYTSGTLGQHRPDAARFSKTKEWSSHIYGRRQTRSWAICAKTSNMKDRRIATKILERNRGATPIPTLTSGTHRGEVCQSSSLRSMRILSRARRRKFRLTTNPKAVLPLAWRFSDSLIADPRTVGNPRSMESHPLLKLAA